MSWELVIVIITGLVLLNYVALIAKYIIGIGRLTSATHSSKQLYASILVAARNEENSILKCLSGLALQDYPIDKLEIIIINDQSTDNTELVINGFIHDHPGLKIKQLFTTGSGGKKAAIRKGIEESNGEIILVTDSDCTHDTRWTREINNYFQSTCAVFIAGPVMMKTAGTLFSKLQALEFNSLLASTAGSIGINEPIMCNGANMAFSREAYSQLRSNSMDERLASGDDVFLLFSMKEKFGAERIAFANSKVATTLTSTNETLDQFIQQRLRWTSKSSSYKDPHARNAAITVFSMNFILLFLLIGIFFNLNLLLSFLMIFISKTIVDTILLYRYSRIFGQSHLLLYTIIAEPLIAIYTVSIGLAGNFTSFKWKGRKVSSVRGT